MEGEKRQKLFQPQKEFHFGPSVHLNLERRASRAQLEKKVVGLGLFKSKLTMQVAKMQSGAVWGNTSVNFAPLYYKGILHVVLTAKR